MVYVGYGLKTAPWETEPSLIDPQLNIRANRSPGSRQDLDYWPSYNRITPENRETYLSWLASGRRASSIPIGYVFLFMYGLERRVLVDIFPNGSLASELLAIRAEMTELLRLYGPKNSSFHHYATGFIDVIDVVTARYTNRTLPAPELRAERFLVPQTLLVRARQASGGRRGYPRRSRPGLGLVFA